MLGVFYFFHLIFFIFFSNKKHEMIAICFGGRIEFIEVQKIVYYRWKNRYTLD